jgi:cyclopropane fatty-acyl-phospholipid synthase-like methyltransferase
MNRETITEYYDYTVPVFTEYSITGTQLRPSHYGFWDGDIKNHKEALLNVNRFMAEAARINSGDTVLDAGCGIGGSTIWLAENRNARGTGITISERQLKKARALARQKGLESLVNFEKRDFLDTGFEGGTFSVVWAIESVCHAEDKGIF